MVTKNICITLLGIIFLLYGCNKENNYNSKCYHFLYYYNVELEGQIIEKYVSQDHGYKYLYSVSNSDTISLLIIESIFWDFVEEGDSIFKNKCTDIVKISKEDSKEVRSFILHYFCSEDDRISLINDSATNRLIMGKYPIDKKELDAW